LHLELPFAGLKSSAASDLPCCGGEFPKFREIKFSAIAEHDERFRRKGEALFPELKPLAFLKECKQLMTEVSWQSEYQQQPFLSSGEMFPIDKFQVLRIKQCAEHDYLNMGRDRKVYQIVVEQEPGSGGKESAEATIRNLAGLQCRRL
jgi:hypothetical protein